MLALLRSSQTPTHSAWLPHSQSNVNASSEDKSSSGSTSTKSASQSEHRVKPGRYSTLHLGQNMRVVTSVHFKRCSSLGKSDNRRSQFKWTVCAFIKHYGPFPVLGLTASGCENPTGN